MLRLAGAMTLEMGWGHWMKSSLAQGQSEHPNVFLMHHSPGYELLYSHEVFWGVSAAPLCSCSAPTRCEWHLPSDFGKELGDSGVSKFYQCFLWHQAMSAQDGFHLWATLCRQ